MSPSKMRNEDLPAWSLALALGATVWALYQNTLASVHYPDAIAYARQVEQHQLFHPHHLLYNWMGYFAALMSQAVKPDWELMDALQQCNAFLGAAGAGLVTWWLARHTGRAVLSLLFGAGTALLYGWWSVSVTWEVHIFTPILLLAALATLVESAEGRGTPLKQGALLGALLGVGALFHETAALAGPALLAGSWAVGGSRQDRLRRAGALVGVATALVAVAYLGAMTRPDLLAARSNNVGEFALRDALQAHPDAGDPSRLRALLRGFTRVAVYLGPARCNFGNAAPEEWAPENDRIHGLAAAALVLSLVLSTAAAWKDALGRYRPLSVALGVWALVALPFITWWEPANYEYSLGLSAGLLLWGALGSAAALDRQSGVLRQQLPLLIWALPLLLVGAQNLRADLGPAAWVGGDHRQCTPAGAGGHRRTPKAPSSLDDGPRGPSPDQLNQANPAAGGDPAAGAPQLPAAVDGAQPDKPPADPNAAPLHPMTADEPVLKPETTGDGSQPPENVRPGRTRNR